MQSITLGHHLTMSHEETRDTAVVLTQYMQHFARGDGKEGTPPGVAKK